MAKSAAQKRAAARAEKINAEVRAGGVRSAIPIDASVLTGVVRDVKFPTRTRGAASVNSGVLAGLRELVKGSTIGATFRLNAPPDEAAQNSLASLVRRAVDQELGTDMGVNVAVDNGFMFIELKKRKVVNRKKATDATE